VTIQPIKTERDYQKALKEIEKLWDAKPNTAKDDRLEVLVTLVEAYEQKHYRIDPPIRSKPSSSASNSLSSS
jgi:HTH-type transcriptional regulator/antitoxin HigA